ncbi:MAG: zinc dependent phospholipase C family protein [Eubacteriales bacterium]
MKVLIKIEKYYGVISNYVFRLLNPFKKIIMNTEAQVHKFNNEQAVSLLKKHYYNREHQLFKYYLIYINNGSVWADQDFKSSSHFYNPLAMKGLFGQPHSKKMTIGYYKKAIRAWNKNNIEKSMFYLGACVHILQDLTVPHHVVNRLLDSHRKYENFVRSTFDIVREYKTDKRPIIFNDLNTYIEYNADKALKLYINSNHLEEKRLKYYKWTKVNLPLSHRTTAGCFLMFLNDVGFYK